MNKNAELVRRAGRMLRSTDSAISREVADDLEALARRLDEGIIVSNSDGFECFVLADNHAEGWQLQGDHERARPFLALRNRLRPAFDAHRAELQAAQEESKEAGDQ